MTNELYIRISVAENFSSDLVHEIRNPLASLKSASEIISETSDKTKRDKLIKILSHDVERIERLITDYSQMLKDEVAMSNEKMDKINLKSIVHSVVDDFNNIYFDKRGIKIHLKVDNSLKNFKIFPMEEIPKPKNLQKTLNFKMSNMKMNIVIKKMKLSRNISDSSWIKETKFNHYTFPTFTKKIFNSLENYL